MPKRTFCTLSALSCIVGVVLLVLSFALNPAPPPDTGAAGLMRFGHQHFSHILWGAWLQAVGPVFIVLFAFALVRLAEATQRLAGWMVLFGASVLMTVSLIEITFYIGALFADPAVMPFISLHLIYASQHLFFIVAAPALFLPLGIVLLNSRVLPRVFGYLALLIATVFAAIGIAFLFTLRLPGPVTALGGIQSLWWLAAAMTLIVRRGRLPKSAAPAPAEVSRSA
jgi:hypothetical protein